MTVVPTPQDIRRSIEKWAKRNNITTIFEPGWDTRGRRWTYGIRGVVEHHWAGTGDGGYQWMQARDGAYPYCNAAIRRDGRLCILSALSAWGSGTGGPWAAAGVPKDLGHSYLWQTEFESWGKEQDFTPEMWKAQAVLDCAIREVAGKEAFPNFKRLINHKDWTDGTAGVSPTPLPTVGRKNDTLYDARVFRDNAKALWKAQVQPA